MKYRFTFLALLCSVALLAQKDTIPAQTKPAKSHKNTKPFEMPDPTPYANGITSDDMKALIMELAGPQYQGRETGQEGQKKAAAFIADQFKKIELPEVGDHGNYFQEYSLQNDSWEQLTVKVNGTEFTKSKDYYVFPAYNNDMPLTTFKQVYFVGYGVEDKGYNDYAKADVQDEAILIYDGEPMKEGNISLITGTEFRSNWSLDWKNKARLAKAKGAKLMFIVDPSLKDNISKNRRMLSNWGWKPVKKGDTSKEYCNTIFITPEMANALLGGKTTKVEDALESLRDKGKFKPVKIKGQIEVALDKTTKVMDGANVLGFIEGSDPNVKDQIVVVSAHYDHLGHVDDVIYYGADDNASGTSGVIEIARAMQEAKKAGKGPRRSVLCLLVSGEEKGLLGSKHYVDYPVYPLKNTVADVNIDMIGRVDNLHEGDPNYIYSIGSGRLSSELQTLAEAVNDKYTKLKFDYKYDDPADPNHYYERSDHYNFVENGVPAVFFFNGTHPDYHKPTDTPDKINFDAAAKRAQLAFHVAWEIANRPARLVTDKKTETKEKN